MFYLFTNLRWFDFIDILLITFVVYQLFILFHRTKGFRILVGLFCLAIIYILVRAWGLFLSTLVFQIFWQALIIFIIIVFQPEIREVLARVNFIDFIQGKKGVYQDASKIRTIGQAVFRMSEERIGCIIVVKQKEDLKNLVMDSIPLDGEISVPIILSIFQKSSPVHDGALIIENGKIKSVAGYLPMTERSNLPKYYGSRHRASLGLSEKSDAIVIVVSEESGEVSIAHNTNIKKVKDVNTLNNYLEGHLLPPAKPKTPLFKSLLSKIFLENWTKKAFAFLIVFVIWSLLAGQQNYSQNLIVPLVYNKIPANMELITPPQSVNVVIKGIRKQVSSLKANDIRIELDVSLAKYGKSTFNISQENIYLPAGVHLIYLEPSVIKLDFKNKQLPDITKNPPLQPDI